MSETFSKNYTVASANTDMFGLCKPSSLLSFMQDTANGHADILGMSRDALVGSYGAVWVMARLRYRLLRPIAGHEPLVITTWHRPPKAAYIYRDFDISASGEHVGEAVTMWAVMNLNTRRIMKLCSVGVIDGAKPYAGCYTEELSKLRPPEALCDCELRLMRYSDTDVNAHVNNARYADFACDAAGAHMLEYSYINGMQVNFGAECFPGETIRIRKAGTADAVYVAGSADDKARFEAVVNIAPLLKNNKKMLKFD